MQLAEAGLKALKQYDESLPTVRGRPRKRERPDARAEDPDDNDNKLDLIVSGCSGTILYKNGGGTFTVATSTGLPAHNSNGDVKGSSGDYGNAFADVRTTMTDGGAAIMGSATAEGSDRAEIAARDAINSPLLDGVSIRGARNVLVNISAGSKLGMRETTTATSIIQQEAGDDAEIILGTVLDESFGDQMRVTVIATGFELAQDRNTVRVAPNKTPNRMAQAFQQANQASNDQAAPAPEQTTAVKTGADAEEASKFVRPNKDYYKGEGNLKRLDTPSYLRRDINARKDDAQSHAAEPTSPNQAARVANFQQRAESTRRDDSEQPAFLRRIMD